MADKLKGKILAINCGANGIGLATAKRPDSERAYVSIIDRKKKKEKKKEC